MYIDWLLPQIELIEKATVALENSLTFDDPSRRDHTSYQHPKSAFVAASFPTIRPSLRSVVLACRLITNYFEVSCQKLLRLDVDALCAEQTFWQRRLCEGFVDMVLLENDNSDSIFSAYLNSQKAKQRGNIYRELISDYGAQVKILEIYYQNDEQAAKLGDNLLKHAKLYDSYESKLHEAWPKLTDEERFALGRYLMFRLRSASVHFGTFIVPETGGNIHFLMLYLTMSLLLCKGFVLRNARMFPLILPEVARLRDSDFERMFASRYQEMHFGSINVGDHVVIFYDGAEHEGIVEEVRNGKYGNSFRIQNLPNQPKWCSVNDFHPAPFVRKYTDNADTPNPSQMSTAMV